MRLDQQLYQIGYMLIGKSFPSKMVKCWQMSDQIKDQREECQREPPIQISLSELAKLGVEYFHIPVDQSTKGLDEISHSRGYNYRDEIVVNRERLPNYESRIKQFFEEHLHTDEEVRYILEGAGYFDVRTADDEQWIRILTEPGDLIILPPGIFHRFTVTMDDFIHAIRLFKGEPVWTPYNRNAKSEGMEVYREYLRKYGQKA